MKFVIDPLYTIFEEQLHKALMQDETSEVLVDNVIKEYTDLVTRQGLVPYRLIEFVELDAREEVNDMLKKKTYGHFNFADYKQSQKSKSKKRGNA